MMEIRESMSIGWSEDYEKRRQELKNKIKSYPGFPKPDVVFRDIFSLMRDPVDLKDLVDLQVEVIKRLAPDAEALIGIESRGFLFASAIGVRLNLPVLPIRKNGKLPGDVERISYALEYGTDTLEIQKDALCSVRRIVLLDDLIATGGSMEAAANLVEKLGGEVLLLFALIELIGLTGRQRLQKWTIASLFEF